MGVSYASCSLFVFYWQVSSQGSTTMYNGASACLMFAAWQADRKVHGANSTTSNLIYLRFSIGVRHRGTVYVLYFPVLVTQYYVKLKNDPRVLSSWSWTHWVPIKLFRLAFHHIAPDFTPSFSNTRMLFPGYGWLVWPTHWQEQCLPQYSGLYCYQNVGALEAISRCTKIVSFTVVAKQCMYLTSSSTTRMPHLNVIRKSMKYIAITIQPRTISAVSN